MIETYSSPPFRDITSLSYDMKAAVEQSRDNLIPSCTSASTEKKIISDNANRQKMIICIIVITKFYNSISNLYNINIM